MGKYFCNLSILILFQSLAFSAPTNRTSEQYSLVVFLVIDQMRFDHLTRFSELYTGGFRKLLDNGAVFRNAKYRHAITETAPGYSVVMSGRYPRNSGVIANSWYDRALKRFVNVIEDPMQAPLGGKGRSASPKNLIGFTVGDYLKQNDPRSKVIGVSAKDRSAILMAGRLGDGAYWFEPDGGNFITSSYYMDKAPNWLQEWNRRRIPDRYAGNVWKRLIDDTLLYEQYAGSDEIEGEWPVEDRSFPHILPGTPNEKGFHDYLMRTPFLDEITLSLAMSAFAVNELGQDGVTDIFAVGFSATDFVGHRFGPDSHEVMDQLLRLDVLIGRLLNEIDMQIGLNRTLVVLSSDHGVLPLVESLAERGLKSSRVKLDVFEAAIAEALEKHYPGQAGLVADISRYGVYLSDQLITDFPLKRDEVEDIITEALQSTGLVAAVYSEAQLKHSSIDRGGLFSELYTNSFVPLRSPHLTFRPRKYVFISGSPGGTGHGSPYDYDRHIPMIFMGKDIRTGFYSSESGPEDIVPTVGHLLDIEFPTKLDGRVLSEILLAGED